jgi:hypothetical protein
MLEGQDKYEINELAHGIAAVIEKNLGSKKEAK